MYRFSSLATAICLALVAGAASHPADAWADGRADGGPVEARTGAFPEHRAALLASLAEARAAAPTPGRDDAEAALLLELAELHLQVAFVPEGAALVAALAQAPLRQAQSARRGALRAAFASLDAGAPSSGLDARGVPLAAPPPLRALGDLPAAALLRAGALARSGRAAEALDLVAGSSASLDAAARAARCASRPAPSRSATPVAANGSRCATNAPDVVWRPS